MTTKHTPGPWKIVGNAISSIPAELFNVLIGIEYEDGECPIMAVHNVNGDYADAKLIAAAPELLEAIKALLERYVLAIGNEGIECLTARAAIAKATGEQP